MNKRSRQTTDNFIIRRSSDAPLKTTSRESTRPNAVRRTISAERRQIGEAHPNFVHTALEQSLAAIDNEQVPERSGRRHKRSKQNGKVNKHPRRKKLTRIIILVIVAIFVLTAGYFIWKTLFVGGKIFNGNPLAIFNKQRLVEDANGRTNILIFGTSGYTMDENNGWDGGLLTDSIMVVTFDQDTHDVYSISLPRDLYVKHTCTNSLGTTAGRLNETYYCGYMETGKQEDGAKALMQKAGEITGLDVQYYAHANWSALKDGVDAVGGVDVKIESDDPRGIYDVATGIRYKNGEIVHMDGETALAFSRARQSEGGYGLGGSNFDREKNQQRLLTALQEKIVSADTMLNPVAISRLLDTLGDNLRTNFKTEEVQALIDVTKGISGMTSLPFVGREDDAPDLVKGGNVSGASVVVPVAGIYDYSEIHSYITGSIRGTLGTTIDVLNGSEVSGAAQSKADELEDAGYTIGTVGNAPATISEKIQLYRVNTAEKAHAATAALEQRYSVTAITGLPKGYTPEESPDFVLIIGE